MPMRRLRQLRSEEGGFALIEVLISALIVVLITAAVVQVLTATGRASTEERHRAQAFSVAQEDQARLRSMQISTLQQGLEPRVVTVAGTPFTVKSTAVYVSSKTGTTKCGGEGKADYIRIGSSVTWPTMHEGEAPILIESILSPTSGSVESTSGGLAVSLLNSRATNNGIAGVPVSVSGPGTFFGSTNSEGCVLFGGVPTGTYTVTPTLPGSGWVDQNGEPPEPLTVNVTGGTTAFKEAHYDKAGTLTAKFEVRSRFGEPKEPEWVKAYADSMFAFNNGGNPRSFTTAGGKRVAEIKGESLYPFETSYAVRAGSCGAGKGAPIPEPEAEAFQVVPVGGSAEVMIKLPALYLSLRNSKGTTAEQLTGVAGAKVTLTDLFCKNSSEENIKREYKTTELGSLGAVTPLAKEIPKYEEPGVPTGEYAFCASKGGRKIEVSNLLVRNMGKEGTPLSLDLAKGTAGSCP